MRQLIPESQVRVCQNKMIDEMIKEDTSYGYAQRTHMREIRLAQPARFVDLREKHLPGRTFRCPPVLFFL